MALVRVSGPVECEIRHLVEPEPDGTRFTLTYRFTNPRVPKAKEKFQARLEKEVAKHKVLLEGTGAPQRT
jgi:hypothetical protein